MLDLVRADRARAGVIPHDVVVRDVVVQLVVRADAKPELRFIELALAPVEEVRALVLHVTEAIAPRQEREQVRKHRARVAVPVPVHGTPITAVAELNLAARAHALTPHSTHAA